MTDEIFDRTYQHGREALHSGIDRLAAKIAGSLMAPFERLQAIQFASPWAKARRDRSADAHCA